MDSLAQNDENLRDAFREFVANPDYPCVGAKAALSRDQMTILVARDFASAWDDLRLQNELARFAQEAEANPKLFISLVVLFQGPRNLDETQFETLLWERLQSIHDKDVWRGYSYDPRVDKDPGSPHFSFSVGGKAFFVIGLHPHASRQARRFATPALVFNVHSQFEQLREEGRYDKLHARILSRDFDYSGSINPMLSKHGEVSAARQYSGRRADTLWECPFHPKDAEEIEDDL